jgi:L-cysteine desulfidase
MKATEILKEMTSPVMGCTEPAAIALAASLACRALGGEVPDWVTQQGPTATPRKVDKLPQVEMIALRSVRSLYKNALAVGIPGTAVGGIHLAAALGAFLDPAAGLNLLKANDDEVLAKARALLQEKDLVTLEVRDGDHDVLFVEARVIGVIDGERHVGEVVLRGRHDGIELVRRDGRILWRNDQLASRAEQVEHRLEELGQMHLPKLVALAESLDQEGIDHILEGVRLNRAAGQAGIDQSLGLKVGATLSQLVNQGQLANDMIMEAKRLAAGAADARMSGAEVEIMSSSGSGNQGIMAVVPIAAVATAQGIDDVRMARAVALSHLVTAATTMHTGLLSALCGCVVKAGLGASAGLAYLLGAPIDAAITNMAGNITGEICDGAKVGCAVKICTAAGAAVESALLALHGVRIPASNGILAEHPHEVFQNIGAVAQSMRAVDRTIVHIMEGKENLRRHVSPAAPVDEAVGKNNS